MSQSWRTSGYNHHSTRSKYMRVSTVVLIGLMAFLAVEQPHAQENPFLGAWNLSGDPPRENFVYWLEVKTEGGTLSAMFLNRGGSPVPAENVKIADGELSFVLPASGDQRPKVSLRAAGEKLTGTVTA